MARNPNQRNDLPVPANENPKLSAALELHECEVMKEAIDRIAPALAAQSAEVTFLVNASAERDPVGREAKVIRMQVRIVPQRRIILATAICVSGALITVSKAIWNIATAFFLGS